MQELNAKDRAILIELDHDARQTCASIGKKVRLTKEAVAYRMKSLAKNGYVLGYYTVIDMSRIGYRAFRAYVRLRAAGPAVEQKITNYLRNEERVWWLARITGPYDIVVVRWAKSNHEFQAFWLAFLNKFRGYVEDQNISLMTRYTEYTRSYLKNEEKRVFDTMRDEEGIDIDKTDMQILSIMAGDARIPLVSIAKKIGSNPMRVKYRLKRLMKLGVIKGFRPIFNLKKLGLEYYKINMNLEDTRILDQLRAFELSCPWAVYSESTIGGADFEFDLEIKDVYEMSKVINGLKKRFKGTIRNYWYFSILEFSKIIYAPPP